MIYQLLLAALFATIVVQGISLENEDKKFEELRADSVKETSRMGAYEESERKMNPKTFADECLKAHNDYRKKHGVGNLALKKELTAYAQEWANHLASTGKFEHRTEFKYGENIYMMGYRDPNKVMPAKDPVDAWYSEIKDFKFGREPADFRAGHFTQLVWKATKSLGCAFAKSKTGAIYVVANYDPFGNFVGQFTKNVPPPKK